jgi:hypothetical protein
LVAGLDHVNPDGLETYRLVFGGETGGFEESNHSTYPPFEILGGTAVCGDAPPGAPPVETPGVVVKKGDTLWGIAGQQLGDPQRWPEIHALNLRHVPDPRWVFPGDLLQVPPA